MKRFFINKKGNVTLSITLFVCILMGIFILFAIVISKSTFNLMVHEAKSDLYLTGRNVIFAIQRDLMGEDIESVDYDELVERLEKGFCETWSLDKKLKNGEGLIKEVDIEELYFLEAYDNDPVTSRATPGFSLHMVVKVKFMPILFSNLLGDKCEFSLHEDIQIQKIRLE